MAREPHRIAGTPRLALLCVALLAVTLRTTAQPRPPAAARPLELHQTSYRLRAGGRQPIDAPQETLDFIRSAQTRSVTINGAQGRGFVVGTNVRGDEVLLAASLGVKPGDYTVNISAVSGQGEERTASISVAVDALAQVPLNAAGPPVVLLDGWQLNATSSCPMSTDSFGNFGYLETYLNQEGLPVYFFENCSECPNCSIEELANVYLSPFLDSLQYTNGSPVPQIDLIAHSMGGLIVRAYLSGKQATPGVFSPPLNPKVRKAIFLATPHFGSYQADGTLSDILFANGNQTSEMKPGSQFLWDLATWNQFGDDLRGVDALAIVGDAGAVSTAQNASDGVVSLTSASLLFAQPDPRTRIVDYCHVPTNSGSLAETTEGSYLGCTGPGIAYIDTPSHQSYQIISSFLANTSAWQAVGHPPSQDEYLDRYGGLFVAVKNTQDQYFDDVTAVELTGSTALTSGPSNPVTSVYYDEWLLAGSYSVSMVSPSGGTIAGSETNNSGGYRAALFKEGPYIYGVQSSLSTGLPGLTVASGSTITVSGVGFSSPTGTTLLANGVPFLGQIVSDQKITALLPASVPSGLAKLTVSNSNGQDTVNIVVAPQALPPTISLSPTQLQFSYTVGATAPTSQNVVVSNSGGGTFTWSAASGASWLTLSSAPGVLSVSISPTGLSPNTYTGVVTITAAGASNSPQTVSVTLTVIAPSAHPSFFTGETALGSGIYYLQFPDSDPLGYYAYLSNTIIYHFDLGYEGIVDAPPSGAYMYDFLSGHWFYTSSALFPDLYDFTLNAWLYYFPNTKNPGHYTTNPRYFVNLGTGVIFTM
jgi:hypothetical protein